MFDSVQRNYYKIFTGTNQEFGYDKIHLGYESTDLELILKKDNTTSFHIPYFANSQLISESSLIKDGAQGGPIPAFSDRIFKKQANYGNSSPWGFTSDVADGSWFCTWLYEISGQNPIWVDRFYNPQHFSYSQLLTSTPNILNKTEYNNSVLYYDVSSTLTLEPGVLYQYFHIGEGTAKNIVSSFAGDNNQRLRLNIENWTNQPQDLSDYNNFISIGNYNSQWTKTIQTLNYQDRNVLSFNNTDFIDCKVIYDSSYNLVNEFTINFWVGHENWTEASSTQLIGNFKKGGYGIFYDNLNYNPYFVIPEINYGHLFYVNQEGNVYLDKNTQFILGVPVNPNLVSINSDTEIVSIISEEKTLVKYNHVGDVLTVSKNVTGENIKVEGDPKIFLLDGNDECFVVTTSGTYIFDKNLILKSIDKTKVYEKNSQMSFDITGILVKESSCDHLKFDNNNQKWAIKTDKNLYCNNVILSSLPTNDANAEGSNINLAIDPENYIWVLTNTNTVYKIDPIKQTVNSSFKIGINVETPEAKNLSFIKQYNRKKNNFTWFAVIIHNYEKTIYFVTLDGKVYKSIFLPEKLNINDRVIAQQNPENLNFICNTDFTGYDRRRIFNKLKYNNKPQIHFKIAGKYPNLDLPSSIFTVSAPVNNFINENWYLITCSIKNNNIKIYVNGELKNSLQIPGNCPVNYEFKNSLYIGCESGKTDNLNFEIESKSAIWNGYIDSIKIYDYEINPNFISYFINEKTNGADIRWNLKTSSLQYVELIERFFKHKMPGSKSIFFNIKLAGSQISDETLKIKIENEIKKTIQKIKPAYTEFLKIEWIN